jgi:anti-sigma regulatory factor (Ser/Thr protein kinase)
VTRYVFPAEDRRVPAARGFTAAALAGWGVTAEDAGLLVTELASNAVRAAGGTACGQFLVRIRYRPSVVLLEVGDASDRVPVLASRGPGEEHGRGLLLVARLAAECGWYADGTGWKIVWAVVPAVPVPAAAGTGAAAPAGRAA